MLRVVPLLLLFGLVFGFCAEADAYVPDAADDPSPCDLQPVNMKIGAERDQRVVPARATLTPSVPDTTIVGPCGTPDMPLPVEVITALGLRPHAPRAPPRG